MNNNDEKLRSARDLVFEILGLLKLDYDEDVLKENDPELLPYLYEIINNRTKAFVKAALKEAAEKADITYTTEKTWDFTFVDKNSILNSYDLENIK